MSFGQSIRTCLSKYATFEGRATRSEFWWFYLFLVIVALVVSIPGSIIMTAGLNVEGTGADATATLGAAFWIGLALVLIGSLVQLVFLIPMLAVGCRRLHDRGQSGWLQLLMLVPCGSLVLLVFWVLEGTPGENAYGPKPA